MSSVNMEYLMDSTTDSMLSELKLATRVPKLKGESNFFAWRTKLFMVLGLMNEGYVELLTRDDTFPKQPCIVDTSERAVREVLLHEAGNDTLIITDAAIRHRIAELETENEFAKEKYIKQKAIWEKANARVLLLMSSTLRPMPESYIARETNAYIAFQLLRTHFAAPTLPNAYLRYQKLTSLRYEGDNAGDFVRRFKDALRDFAEFAGGCDPEWELCLFHSAIAENNKTLPFVQKLEKLQVLKDISAMDKVYFDFLDFERISKAFH